MTQNYPRRKVIRSLNTAIEINGNSYQLYQVYGEKPYGDYINWDYAELPWYKILPESGKASSMYVLEEWVTVHKPDN